MFMIFFKLLLLRCVVYFKPCFRLYLTIIILLDRYYQFFSLCYTLNMQLNLVRKGMGITTLTKCKLLIEKNSQITIVGILMCT